MPTSFILTNGTIIYSDPSEKEYYEYLLSVAPERGVNSIRYFELVDKRIEILSKYTKLKNINDFLKKEAKSKTIIIPPRLNKVSNLIKQNKNILLRPNGDLQIKMNGVWGSGQFVSIKKILLMSDTQKYITNLKDFDIFATKNKDLKSLSNELKDQILGLPPLYAKDPWFWSNLYKRVIKRMFVLVLVLYSICKKKV